MMDFRRACGWALGSLLLGLLFISAAFSSMIYQVPESGYHAVAAFTSILGYLFVLAAAMIAMTVCVLRRPAEQKRFDATAK